MYTYDYKHKHHIAHSSYPLALYNSYGRYHILSLCNLSHLSIHIGGHLHALAEKDQPSFPTACLSLLLQKTPPLSPTYNKGTVFPSQKA